ncbi:dynein heavy chain 1, cytosolic [Puccinia sorghi]|uniref:Dynein heavy chain 1, cytosolic n=1 Tax=Puccinia sorghi TaxID=27349 RepID=A0A0L6V2F7_9BASI|nr:dynein heavy chain 1, cytosolic [Puccinia sorghi]
MAKAIACSKSNVSIKATYNYCLPFWGGELSKQPHYDLSLQPLKAVLTSAGHLKRGRLQLANSAATESLSDAFDQPNNIGLSLMGTRCGIVWFSKEAVTPDMFYKNYLKTTHDMGNFLRDHSELDTLSGLEALLIYYDIPTKSLLLKLSFQP